MSGCFFSVDGQWRLTFVNARAEEIFAKSRNDLEGKVMWDALPRLYAAADCMVNPSTVDNMPISLLEAFACGLPVVSTDAGGIPDMVEHGVTGLLVPAGDADAMAREICRVLDDRTLAQSLVQAGLAEAQKYAWPRVAALWLAAYRQAAAAGSRA